MSLLFKTSFNEYTCTKFKRNKPFIDYLMKGFDYTVVFVALFSISVFSRRWIHR